MKFKPCKILVQSEGNCFVWPISDETKTKIRDLLEVPDLQFGFNNTVETMPPYFYPDCGTEITFFDSVRESISNGAHAKEFMIRTLQKKTIVTAADGEGKRHYVSCENGHKQPLVMGWPWFGFNWTMDIE